MVDHLEWPKPARGRCEHQQVPSGQNACGQRRDHRQTRHRRQREVGIGSQRHARAPARGETCAFDRNCGLRRIRRDGRDLWRIAAVDPSRGTRKTTNVSEDNNAIRARHAIMLFSPVVFRWKRRKRRNCRTGASNIPPRRTATSMTFVARPPGGRATGFPESRFRRTASHRRALIACAPSPSE